MKDKNAQKDNKIIKIEEIMAITMDSIEIKVISSKRVVTTIIEMTLIEMVGSLVYLQINTQVLVLVVRW